MDEKVIRTQITQGISSRLIRFNNEAETMQSLCLKYGKDVLIKEIFNERDLEYVELCELFDNFVSGKQCAEFEVMYVLEGGFGVVINEHIYLCHCNENVMEQQYEVLPWMYIESKKYIGDTWWFEKEEIIEDIKNLSIIEFLEKYKGY